MTMQRFILTSHPIGPDTGSLAERQAARRARQTHIVGTPDHAAARWVELTGVMLSPGTVAAALRRGRRLVGPGHTVEPV